MIWYLCLGAAAGVGIALLINERRVGRLFANLNEILDEAMTGQMDTQEFSEAHLSKFEAKLARCLNDAKLKRDTLLQEESNTRMLVSDISHQTKTPIANMLLYTELLAEQPELSADSRQLLSQLEAGGHKLAFLVQSLVKLSRLESGTVQVKPQWGNVYTLAHTVWQDCLPNAEQKQIKLKLEQPERDVFALYDAKWCAEAVYNILDNAIKYTPKKGSVSLTVIEYEMFACIRIADTGKGISADELPKIFSRFYRAEDSQREEGVGIGLYLARQIVGECGGYIHATSEQGVGSVFSVYLSKL